MKRASSTKRKEQRKVRLLLHAVDGCVPFLTPDALEKYFPPSDDLWIGLAVRDTCVLPTFSDDRDTPKKIKSNKASKSSNPTVTERDPKKPRGYTFAPVTPDSWLLPYTRVTVPSFNWMLDNTRKKKESSQQLSSGSTSTNQYILVWTPHGRQKLTSALQANASAGLQSKFTLSLYDMAEEPDNAKRLEKAEARNEEWFRDLLKRRKDDSSSTEALWSPILLPPPTSSDPIVTMYHESTADIGGVALIGKWWSGGLESILQAKLQDVPHVAMLTTHSFKEILEIALSNVVDTIGTDLPAIWAKDKLAFAMDLSVNSIENTAKRSRQDDDTGVVLPTLNHDGCMNLHDKSFARDPQPLVPGCNCLACANDKFSRAYIHHLICAQELLADMLLFGHNLHHLLQFIRVFNSLDNPLPWVEGIVARLSAPSRPQTQ